MFHKKLLTVLLILTSALYPLESFAQSQVPRFEMTVTQGQDGTIDEMRTVEVVVRVTVPNADVNFRIMPGNGVSFPGGAMQISVKSDAQGFARSGMISSTGKGGTFDVVVTATYEDQTVTAYVHETNKTAGSASQPTAAPHKSRKMLWIAIIGAGAAGAAFAATKSGGGSDSGPTVTVTAGSPTLGPPQ